MLTRDELRADLAARCFAPSVGAPRIGLEVELIAVDRRTRRAIPLAGIERSMLSVARAAGAPLGWIERRSEKSGASEFALPCGGMLTFEPGAQVEYSAPPSTSASRTLALAREVCDALRRAADARDVELLAVGIDPETPIDEVAPQLDGERYRRMLAHFERIGPAGAMMMRQTASVQLAVDRGAEPLARWRLLNAMTPIVVASFANSPRYAGAPTGHRSVRRHVWASLDPTRTGAFEAADDPVDAYLAFALAAPAFLLGAAACMARPFGAWLDDDRVDLDAWRAHLSTLFPEVRARDGYFELRSADAIEPEHHAALVAMVAAVAYHEPSARQATSLLESPSAALLACAGRCGLTDAGLSHRAATLARLALDACEALGERFMETDDVERAREFFDRYTLRGRSPADDWR